MADLQRAKAVVRSFYDGLDAAAPDEVSGVLEAATTRPYRWRGVHPWNEQSGTDSVARDLWTPLKLAIGPWQRRPDIFFAGTNQLDDHQSVWVTEMGHLMGLWTAPFLGIEPTGKIVFIRYAEFHRVKGDKITETACFIDLVHMIHQAGLNPFAGQTGAAILTPGPRTHDGLLVKPQDPGEGQTTLKLISDMVDDLRALGVSSPPGHIDRFWSKDMCWFGPAGIGASAFREGYRRGHSGPFEEGLDFVRSDGHETEFAEGQFGGFFGYPSITMRATGGFMGMPASDHNAEMRLVDLYRREGDKLAENWIFIDLLHFFAMQGIDILKRLERHQRT